MPVSFNSPARNLFLLGSSGAQVVTNFFKAIDQSASNDGIYLPDEIKYNFVDQKFVLAGSASDSNSKGFGWFEKRDDTGTADWDVRVEAGAGINTTLRAMELDSNDNLIVVGKTGTVPWIAKYSNGGVIDWQSTTNSADVEYTGIISDSNGNYYACGSTPFSGEAIAFVEKFDANGNPGWGKSAFMLGRDVVLKKIAANSRGEVVAVGYLEDDSALKGYIVKIDRNTGEVLWDRTLSSIEYGSDLFNPILYRKDCICNSVFIDSKDQIYIVGEKRNTDNSFVGFIIKYTAEGNMIWQKEIKGATTNGFDTIGIQFVDVKADGETEQVVAVAQSDTGLAGSSPYLYKFSKNGDLVFIRKISTGFLEVNRNVSLDADPSFYYLLFTDQITDGLSGTPDRYIFGKVSSSGNGLGDFEYQAAPSIAVEYSFVDSSGGSSISIIDGRLSDGSVRQDTSDLITYPFNGTKILFDDLATQVSNKKRQMDSADSFEYSGSPAIRPADFQELNLLGDVGASNLVADSFQQTGETNGSFTFVWPNGNTIYETGLVIPDVDELEYSLDITVNNPPPFGAGFVVYMDLLTVNGNFIDYVDVFANTTGSSVVRANINLDRYSNAYTFRFRLQSAGAGFNFTTIDVNYNFKPFIFVPGTNAQWVDQSSNSFVATADGATHNAAGYWEFDGVDDYISIADDPSLHTEEMSWEWWMWNDTIDNSLATAFFAKRTANTNGYMIFTQPDGVINFDFGAPFGDRWSTGYDVSGNLNQWIHCVMTRSSSGRAFYVNGTQYASTSNAGNYIANPSPIDLIIGADSSNAQYYMDGRMGEVRIYPKALTAAQVFQNYNATREKYTGVPASTDPGLTSTRTPA